MKKAKKTAMEIVAEVREQDKKIFFCAKGPVDDPRAWAEMWDREKAAKYVESYLKEAGVADRRFESFRIEFCVAEEDEGSNVLLFSWGERSPGIQFDDYGDQAGLLVELDGKEVFNSLKQIEEDESEED